MTIKNREEILDLWDAGLRAPMIAKRTGVTKETVRSVVRYASAKGDERAVQAAPGRPLSSAAEILIAEAARRHMSRRELECRIAKAVVSRGILNEIIGSS